jgi:hypothetical protein
MIVNPVPFVSIGGDDPGNEICPVKMIRCVAVTNVVYPVQGDVERDALLTGILIFVTVPDSATFLGYSCTLTAV